MLLSIDSDYAPWSGSGPEDSNSDDTRERPGSPQHMPFRRSESLTWSLERAKGQIYLIEAIFDAGTYR